VADQPSPQIIETKKDPLSKRLKDFPWWLVAIFLIAIWAAFIIFSKDFIFSTKVEFAKDLDTGEITEALKEEFEKHDLTIIPAAEIAIQEAGEEWKITSGRKVYFIIRDNNELNISALGDYGEAFNFTKAGLTITIKVSLTAYGFALIFGLLAGLGRISSNIILNNISRLYVELIRGIPMLVLIFFIALVGVPIAVESLTKIGIPIDIKDISMSMRAITALSVTYGAFLAEIFRAGIQSIGRGQMEAARSVGMSYGQAMRYVILPQAVRNVLPALGNDFVAMVKDSSLVSVLAVRDITQMARLHAGSTFRFREAYITLAVMYLTMTVVLSLVVQVIERRLSSND